MIDRFVVLFKFLLALPVIFLLIGVTAEFFAALYFIDSTLCWLCLFVFVTYLLGW